MKPDRQNMIVVVFLNYTEWLLKLPIGIMGTGDEIRRSEE
jgi:hypothetical protein